MSWLCFFISSVLRAEIEVSLDFTGSHAVDEYLGIQIPDRFNDLSGIRCINHRVHQRLVMMSMASLPFHDRRSMVADFINHVAYLPRLISHNKKRRLLIAAVEQMQNLRGYRKRDLPLRSFGVATTQKQCFIYS